MLEGGSNGVTMKGSYKTMLAVSLLLMTAFAAFCCISCEDIDAAPGTTFDDGSLTYKVNADGVTVTLTGYVDGNKPHELNIDTVTYKEDVYVINTIDTNAFEDCNTLGVVTFSTSVEYIGAQAFKGCISLDTIALSSTVKTIESKAFAGCTSVRLVIIPPTVGSIATDAFEGCSFFETDGQTQITNISLIKGFKFQGDTVAKLVKLKDLYVHYDLDGGSGSVDDLWIAQNKVFRVADYDGVKVGFIYGGWTDGKSTYTKGMTYPMGDESITLKAVWKPVPTYKISYDINGATGTVPESFEAHEGFSFMVAPCTATKAGYEFGGWTDGKKTYNAGATYIVGSASVVLKAVWNAIPFRAVTYDVDGGSEKAPTQEKVMQGSMISVAKYSGTKDGYSFGGWDDGEEIYSPGDLYTVGSSSVRFVAVWNLVPTHVVIYDVDGGEPKKNAQIVQENTSFYLEDYTGTKDGYIFKGWSDGKNTYAPGDKYQMADKDLTFKAVWESKNPEYNTAPMIYIVILTIILIAVLYIALRVLPRRR